MSHTKTWKLHNGDWSNDKRISIDKFIECNVWFYFEFNFESKFDGSYFFSIMYNSVINKIFNLKVSIRMNPNSLYFFSFFSFKVFSCISKMHKSLKYCAKMDSNNPTTVLKWASSSYFENVSWLIPQENRMKKKNIFGCFEMMIEEFIWNT